LIALQVVEPGTKALEQVVGYLDKHVLPSATTNLWNRPATRWTANIALEAASSKRCSIGASPILLAEIRRWHVLFETATPDSIVMLFF
jgi:hypothetical protein